jgi:hypothetical protein
MNDKIVIADPPEFYRLFLCRQGSTRSIQPNETNESQQADQQVASSNGFHNLLLPPEYFFTSGQLLEIERICEDKLDEKCMDKVLLKLGFKR